MADEFEIGLRPDAKPGDILKVRYDGMERYYIVTPSDVAEGFVPLRGFWPSQERRLDTLLLAT